MPEITVGQLSEEQYRKLQEEASRRGVPIEDLAAMAMEKALNQRAKRVVRNSNVIGLKRP